MLPLPTLMQQCAPTVAPTTVGAIVRVESGGNALAIHDNTARRSYAPRSPARAQALLDALLRQHHSVDAGLMQINSVNFPRFGLTSASVFDPCTNLRVGAEILQQAWGHAVQAGLHGQQALFHAVEAYNSGNLHGAPGYASAVFGAAGHQVDLRLPAVHRVASAHASRIHHDAARPTQWALNWAPANVTWGIQP